MSFTTDSNLFLIEFILRRAMSLFKLFLRMHFKWLVSLDFWQLDESEYAEFDGVLHYFYFGPEMLLLVKLCPKYENYLFKMNLDIWTNSNILNWMVMLVCLVLDRKYTFWGNLDRNIKSACLRWKLVFWLRLKTKGGT